MHCDKHNLHTTDDECPKCLHEGILTDLDEDCDRCLEFAEHDAMDQGDVSTAEHLFHGKKLCDFCYDHTKQSLEARA